MSRRPRSPRTRVSSGSNLVGAGGESPAPGTYVAGRNLALRSLLPNANTDLGRRHLGSVEDPHRTERTVRQQQRGFNAEALQDSYVCEAGGPEFLAILARHPLMMAKVMMAMARQMFRLERTIESLAREPVDSRLARLLTDLQSSAQKLSEGFLLPAMTREDMAKICITTRESVSRTLSAWSKDGIVELRGRRILLRDPRRLRDLIQGSDR